MRKKIFALLCIALFCSHDMYLKMDTYFLKPNQPSQIQLFNGTFDESENVIDRDRMLDASLFGNGKRLKIDENQWSEKDSITFLNFNSGDAGTWVAGVSTKARNIEMKADAFNKYLKQDGVKDMLLQREENNTLQNDAVEKYSKHVKTIFQVGDKKTQDWNTVLGYPIEFIPLENPYEKSTGENLKIKLFRDGKPLANQLVYADFKSAKNGHSHNSGDEPHAHKSEKEHAHSTADNHTHENESHSHENDAHSHGDKTHSHKNNEERYSHREENSKEDENHTHTTGQELRTDSDGIISVNLTNDGIWYVRTINLVNSDEEGLTHESNWATLTFEVTHKHDAQSHFHEHEEEEGMPMYLFIIGSILIIGVLFFVFNRKK